MACSNIYKGLNIRWGTNGITGSAFGASAIITSADVENTMEKTEIKDQRGNTVALSFTDAKDIATIEYIVADASTAAGNAVITKPSVGDTITISDSVGANDIAGTNWIVDNVSQKQMNTDACKVSIKATAYCGI